MISDQTIKYFLTAFILVLLPTYYLSYGPYNFLWFSDIGLFLILFSLWYRSALLISMSAIITMFIEAFWIFDYFYTLLVGVNLLGIAGYMFDENLNIYLRGLSLFHIFLPIMQIKYMRAWGYDSNALLYGITLYWLTLITCYAITPMQSNINWVHMADVKNWQDVTPILWMSMLMFLYPLIVMAPKSYCFNKIFNKKL